MPQRRSKDLREAKGGPSLDAWRPLFDVASRIHEQAPWRHLDEGTLFGVQDPGSGEVNYVSIMGRLGEHRAVAVYLGAAGLHGMLHAHWSAGETVAAEDVLTVPQLQLSFEERSMLTAADRAVLRDLGLCPRGLWPQCRSYVPGYVPRPLTAAEIPVLTAALEATLAVAPTLTSDPTDPKPAALTVYRRALPPGDGWGGERRAILPPPLVPLGMIPPDLVAALRDLPATSAVIEAGLAMQLLPIRDPGMPPCFPFVLLLVEAHTGMILGMDVLLPVPDLSAVRTAAPANLVRQLIGLGRKPKELRLTDPALVAACQPLDAAGVRVASVAALPAFAAARREMDGYLAGQRRH